MATARVELADRKSARELDRVICSQRVACCFSCARDEHWLGRGDDRKTRARVEIAVEVEFERTDQSAGGCILQLARSCLAPQRGGHLHTRERRDDERIEPPDCLMPDLVGIELYERRRIGKGAQ